MTKTKYVIQGVLNVDGVVTKIDLQMVDNYGLAVMESNKLSGNSDYSMIVIHPVEVFVKG